MVKMLNSDDTYSNEKLVYIHIFIFVAFTLVVLIEYSISFVLGIVINKNGDVMIDSYYKYYWIK